jgi:hypothetical protein
MIDRIQYLAKEEKKLQSCIIDCYAQIVNLFVAVNTVSATPWCSYLCAVSVMMFDFNQNWKVSIN